MADVPSESRPPLDVAMPGLTLEDLVSVAFAIGYMNGVVDG